MASYLSESFDMVGQLPARLLTEQDPVVANACLESCLVHVRLLAEFLVRRPKAQDFSSLDFLWPLPSSPAAERLGKSWEVVSQQVVHFSRKRVPDNVSDVEVVEDVVGWLGSVATDALAVAGEFVATMEAMGHREAARLRRSLIRNQQRLAETLALPGRPQDAAVRMPLL